MQQCPPLESESPPRTGRAPSVWLSVCVEWERERAILTQHRHGDLFSHMLHLVMTTLVTTTEDVDSNITSIKVIVSRHKILHIVQCVNK